MTNQIINKFENKGKVMGHPAGLFVLFFTEMWERFSYYGMRALLVLFLVSALGIGGWEWSREEALYLYAIYTGLVYITPIFGGLIADKLTGFRVAILIGALLMTLGHASMAFETEATFYLGLGLLILGNGLFKPNISSIVGGLYKGNEEKKDAAYTIFYMGINAGAFLGILLCGYVGEKAGWSYGFGLAGIFMFIGMVMFYFSKKLFGSLGDKPVNGNIEDNYDIADSIDELGQPENKSKVVSDRLMVIFILAFFTIFFWWAFEQAGGSMTIFAKDYTNRILEGDWAVFFTVINTVITVVPLAIITYVLFLLVKATMKKIPFSNISLVFSFAIIWVIVGWMIKKEFNTKAYEVTYSAYVANEENGVALGDQMNTVVRTDAKVNVGDKIVLLDVDQKGTLRYISSQASENLREDQKIEANIQKLKEKEIEVPASWFGILNSLFIICFAPLFSKIWESKYNPSAPVKFAIGLILLGLGFGVLSIGSMGIQAGASAASVSMMYLILAYLLHTLGELALSPVGLSYVSKLAPEKLVGLMFGVWFGATALANYIAGWTGSYIDKISEEIGLSGFFLIFTAIPVIAGLILVLMNKFMLKKMHGIK